MPARRDQPFSPGPTCRHCNTIKIWGDDRWRCRTCLTRQQQDRRERLDDDKKRADDDRANALRRIRMHQNEELRKRNRAGAKAWREANPDRQRQASREWYRKNAEQARAAKLAQYYANPEPFKARNFKRAALIEGSVCEHGAGCVTATFLKVLYASTCMYCGEPAQHADHFYPLSLGGLHCVENLVPACAPCNLSKHNTDPAVWLVRAS